MVAASRGERGWHRGRSRSWRRRASIVNRREGRTDGSRASRQATPAGRCRVQGSAGGTAVGAGAGAGGRRSSTGGKGRAASSRTSRQGTPAGGCRVQGRAGGTAVGAGAGAVRRELALQRAQRNLDLLLCQEALHQGRIASRGPSSSSRATLRSSAPSVLAPGRSCRSAAALWRRYRRTLFRAAATSWAIRLVPQPSCCRSRMCATTSGSKHRDHGRLCLDSLLPRGRGQNSWREGVSLRGA